MFVVFVLHSLPLCNTYYIASHIILHNNNIQLWEVLVPSRLIRVNSFAGHRWHIVVNNVRVATWTVVNDPKANQDFVVSYKVNEFACLCGGGVVLCGCGWWVVQ